MATPAVQLVEAPEAASVMLEPTRARLLAALEQPASAAELARRVGAARQRVNYHLRELERVGAVELAEERRKGNCVERVVRRAASSYLIDPAILGRLGEAPAARRDRFSWAYLISTLARAIRDLAALRRRADSAGQRLATLTVEVDVRFGSPAAMRAFAEDAANALAAAAARHHDDGSPEGRAYRFVLAGLPVITKQPDGESPDGERSSHDDEG